MYLLIHLTIDVSVDVFVAQVLHHFDGIMNREMDKSQVWTEDDVLALLQANCQSWRGGADAAAQAAVRSSMLVNRIIAWQLRFLPVMRDPTVP